MNGEISTPPPAGDILNSEGAPDNPPGLQELRDIAEVPAVEVITAAAVHLMSAAAVKCGLAEDAEADLDQARKLITALAAPAPAAAPGTATQPARPVPGALPSLQLASRQPPLVPDPPGQGPGERWT